MSAGRSCVAGFLVGALLLGHACAEEPLRIDEGQLLARYVAYKNGPIPIVSEMNGGRPILLVYEDGQVIFPDDAASPQSPLERKTSGFLQRRLSSAQVAALLQRLTTISGFWDLQPSYSLAAKQTDLPTHTIRLHVPNRPEKSVSVYGPMDAKIRENAKNSRSPYLEPPAAFSEMDELLRNFRPETTQPWDPGFVEIRMSDFSYARGSSLPWPAGWPGLESSLVRSGPAGNVIKYMMVFPSESIAELQAFLARRGQGAIQFGEKKLSLGLRWPFPGENMWSTWNF